MRKKRPEFVLLKKDIVTLIFAVASLHFLMNTFLHFSLQDSSSRGLVKPGDFKDMRRVDPIVGSSPHQALAFHFELVDRNLYEIGSTVLVLYLPKQQ